jgi:hypothetical protein
MELWLNENDSFDLATFKEISKEVVNILNSKFGLLLTVLQLSTTPWGSGGIAPLIL